MMLKMNDFPIDLLQAGKVREEKKNVGDDLYKSVSTLDELG